MAPAAEAGRLATSVRRHPAELVDPETTHACSGGTHTRLADGRRLCWAPADLAGCRVAVDAEMAGQPVPSALASRAARAGVSDPAAVWRLWTRAEARAKVLDVPITLWLKAVDWLADADADPHDRTGGARHGLRRVEVLTVVGDDLVVTYAAAPPADAGSATA